MMAKTKKYKFVFVLIYVFIFRLCFNVVINFNKLFPIIICKYDRLISKIDRYSIDYFSSIN